MNYTVLGGMVAVALAIFYIIVRWVVLAELKRTLPHQINSIRQVLGENNLRMVIEIDKDGRTKIIDFQEIHRPDYMR